MEAEGGLTWDGVKVPYLNMDDGFAEHPKIDRLSDASFRLHVSGLLYSAKWLTDGRVDREKVRRLVPTYRPRALDELLSGPKPLWLPNADGDFLIHDYLEWNKSRAWWDEKRAKDAKRLAEWRAKQAENEEGNDV
jgi:hypothetical protein